MKLGDALTAREPTELSGKMSDFVSRVANGTPPTDAAQLAGYAVPHVEAYRLLRHPKIQKYLQKTRQARIDGELAGLALSTLKDLLTDKETPAEVRRKAAKDVLEMAGHGAKAEQNQGIDPGKPLSEYTEADFAAAIQQAEERASKLRNMTQIDMKTIDAEVVSD